MSTSASALRTLIERAAEGRPVGLAMGKVGRGVSTFREPPSAKPGPFGVSLVDGSWKTVAARVFRPSEVEEAIAFAIAWVRDGRKP